MSPAVPAAEKGWAQCCDAGSPFCPCCSLSSSVLLAGSCQRAPSAFLHPWDLQTPQDVKKEKPLFPFCLWRFCCLTWYEGWCDHFLCCALNFVSQHSSSHQGLHVAPLQPAWLRVGCSHKGSTAGGDGSAGIHTAAALLLSCPCPHSNQLGGMCHSAHFVRTFRPAQCHVSQCSLCKALPILG